jgi:hypothetical protein
MWVLGIETESGNATKYMHWVIKTKSLKHEKQKGGGEKKPIF